MIQTCCLCHHIIQEGQKVRVMVEATYNLLKFSVSYALDKKDLEADASTLCHVRCLNDT